jgi:predicted Zn-dependent peptidase
MTIIDAPRRPTPGPTRDYRFPAFERLTLDNGLAIVVAPVAKLPVVTVMALIDAGAAADPRGQEGVAQLTAHVLAEGTERSEGAELAERFERLGTALDTSADWDSATARVTVTPERLPEALALIAEVIRTPSFSEREVERLKQERLTELLQQQAEPRGLADDMFGRFVYSPSSRYALPDGGIESTVGALDRDAVRDFYRTRYAPTSTTLIIVGDVTRESAQAMVADAFGTWSGPIVPRAVISDAPATRTRMIHIVEKADAPQSELRVGHVGVPRLHPDFFPIVVMNAILGGLFSSRINLNLREEHAYTYGAFSSFDWRREAGPFTVATAVRSDVTDAAVREILLEIERMQATEVSDAELTLATSYLDGVFPIRFESTNAIANAIASVVSYGLPDDYFDRYRATIRAVTAGDVLRAARRYLRLAELQIVTVGDPDVVRAPLESLGVGAVQVHDAEGSPAP